MLIKLLWGVLLVATFVVAILHVLNMADASGIHYPVLIFSWVFMIPFSVYLNQVMRKRRHQCEICERNHTSGSIQFWDYWVCENCQKENPRWEPPRTDL